MNWKNLLSSQRSNQKQQPYSEVSRSAFEQDYDRIIFSHPFRKLQDKTQVHPLPEHDFVHTRLTHSLEVSSVGRSFGRRIGEIILQRYPDLKESFSLYDFGGIVATASLTHDLGNPPFGHAGEDAISDFFLLNPTGSSLQEKVTEAEWKDLTNFEGNAQGFRILNKNLSGLKITYAILGAFTKYPCPALFPERNASNRSQKKFGFFQSEKSIFTEMADQLQLIKVGLDAYKRHPLAFLVEAADDICYSIIDLEDGCNLGLVTYEKAKELLEDVIIQSKIKLGKLDTLKSKHEKIGYLRALAISDLMNECSELFLEHEKEMLTGKFDTALADLCPSKDGLKQIVDISKVKIYRARQVVEIEAAGHEVLPGLLEEFLKTGSHIMKDGSSRKYSNLKLLLPEETVWSIQHDSENHYGMARQVVDFVSGLTDRHAISLYKKIKGFAV